VGSTHVASVPWKTRIEQDTVPYSRPTIENKMCYETQMPLYKINSRGGHHHQNPRSRFQNLWLQYKGLVTRNMHMKYKSPITYHSKDMANVNVFEK
jgi:hypothetical protein